MINLLHPRFYTLIASLILGWVGFTLPVQAVTYPAINFTNFPSGIYDPTDPHPMRYRYFQPVGYNPTDTATKYPLVLFLHGLTEKGTDNNIQLTAGGNSANSSMIFISSAAPPNQTTKPCFWVAPQLDGYWLNWDQPTPQVQLEGILKYFIHNFNIDVDRIYITGLSLGGGGTFAMLVNYPNRFAAAAPISGWGNATEGQHKYIPIWMFHAANDTTQYPINSDNAVAHLREAGGNPIYTRYATGGHQGGWTGAYSSNTPLVEWMFAQRRGQPNNLSPVFRVNTSSPTTGLAWVSNSTSLTLSGTTEDPGSGVTGLAWTNYRWPYTTGTITGTTSWSSSIPLLTGTNPGNMINILATSTNTFGGQGGNTTFSKAMDIHYSATADTTAPAVTIVTPTSSSSYTISADNVTLGGTATDNLGVVKVLWSSNRGGNGTAKGSFSGSTYNWTIPGIDLWSGSNVITVTAYDATGNTSTDTITVTWGSASNAAPTVNAGSDQTITLPSTATLSGSVTDDGVSPGNPTPTAAWTVQSKPAGSTVGFGNASAASTTATFSAAGTYVLRLTGSDGVLNTTDDVTITVNAPANQPPTVNAGIDQVITLPSTASLAGTVSDDGLAPGNPTPTVSWSKVSPAGSTVTFGTPNAVNTTATFSAAGTYVLRLTANDGALSTIDDITVTVNPAGGGGGGGLTVLFDFGSITTSGNWNNVSSTTVGTKITNAVNSTGGATTIGLNVTAAFDGVSGAGFTGTTGAYPATAVQDSFFVQAAAVGKVKLTGLNPSQIYDLTFFGSRMGGGTNRVTQYKIGTITPATLDATDNTNYTISILGVTPAVDGTIEVEVKNDPGTGYGYLGVLELSIPSNQPPVVSAGSDQTITLPSTASLSGSVSDDGLAPGNPTPTVTWTKVSPAGSTVTFGTPNAVNTTATFSAAGTYVLRLTATDGVLSTSDDITVNVNAAPSSVLFDFGTITTSGNWNNVTTTTVGTKITAAINSTGGTTGIGLNVSAAFDNISGVGSTSPTGVYPANAMQDSFFVQTPTVGKVKLTGLNPSTSYTLTFFGSRIGGGANRVTQYKVGTTTRTLDATDNSTAVATMPGMTPAGDGTIEVEVKNDAGTGYGYLGVLQLDW